MSFFFPSRLHVTQTEAPTITNYLLSENLLIKFVIDYFRVPGIHEVAQPCCVYGETCKASRLLLQVLKAILPRQIRPYQLSLVPGRFIPVQIFLPYYRYGKHQANQVICPGPQNSTPRSETESRSRESQPNGLAITPSVYRKLFI